MEETRKHLMDKFQKHLISNYEVYCAEHQMPTSFSGFVTYLIDFELISTRAVKQYTILEEFKECFPENRQKTATVSILASRFNISTRSIWTILKKGDLFEKKEKINKE